MGKTKCLLTYAVAVTAFTVFANPVARATEEGLPSPGVTADRVCEAKMMLGPTTLAIVKIEAGPGLVTEFPMTGPCPPEVVSDTGSCSEWEYRWTVVEPPGLTLTTALIAVDTDISILASDPPGATVVRSLPGSIPLDSDGERFLKFNVPNLTEFTGRLLTPANITPGTLTTAFIGKKGSLPRFARCPSGIAGADNRAVQSSNEATAAKRSYEIPGCTVTFNVDQDNKVIPGTTVVVEDPKSGDTCIPKETTVPITIDGTQVLFVGPAQYTKPGSCSYSWTNTAGGSSTVTCSTCCVKKSTGQCVQKSTLSSPSTQCKAGTL